MHDTTASTTGLAAQFRRVDVDGGGVSLYTEGWATDRTEVIVLLAGAAMQATAWEGSLIQTLLAAGLGVIRFDWRDIGPSTWRRFKEHPYTIETLAEDVVAAADAWDVRSFHVVGFSMGGCVAQLVALGCRDRVRSMVVLSSGFASQIDVLRPDRGRQLFELYALPRPDSEDELVERLVEQWRLLCGSGVPFDDDEWTRRVRAYVARGQNPACPHVRLGPRVFGVNREAALRSLEVPTLVLHGSDDPMIPLPHGARLAATLPSVELEVVEGRGHDLHLHAATPERIAAHVASAATLLG